MGCVTQTDHLAHDQDYISSKNWTQKWFHHGHFWFGVLMWVVVQIMPPGDICFLAIIELEILLA